MSDKSNNFEKSQKTNSMLKISKILDKISIPLVVLFYSILSYKSAHLGEIFEAHTEVQDIRSGNFDNLPENYTEAISDGFFVIYQSGPQWSDYSLKVSWLTFGIIVTILVILAINSYRSGDYIRFGLLSSLFLLNIRLIYLNAIINLIVIGTGNFGNMFSVVFFIVIPPILVFILHYGLFIISKMDRDNFLRLKNVLLILSYLVITFIFGFIILLSTLLIYFDD